MILKGKKGIIFGALDSNSIAWKVAVKCVEEGAELVLTNAPVAFRFRGETNIKMLAEQLNCKAIPADATSTDDLEKLIDESMELLGGKIDFVLHSIGMSINIRKNFPYTDLNHDFMMKSIDISAISFHKMMQHYGLCFLTLFASMTAISGVCVFDTKLHVKRPKVQKGVTFCALNPF